MSNIRTALQLAGGKAALLAFSSTISLTAAPAAVAQDAALETDGDVIVVSARRRDESLQDVPVAVSAFSGEKLNALGVVDLTDIEAITPNVTLETSRSTNSTITAFIRGVGQQDPVAGFEAGVGIYIDDIYLNRPQAALLDVYDVERIEVLRGPQGTLYGRNTIGGAIKYVTRRLADEPQASVRVTGGTYGQIDAIGSFSLPLLQNSGIGDLKFGGSVGYFHRNGFGDNLNLNGVENYNKEVLAGRATIEWDPAEAFSLRITGDWTDDNSDPRQGHRLLDFTGFPVLDDVFDTRSGLNSPEQSVVSRGVSATAEWRLNDNFTLKNIVGYRDDETFTPIDFDSLPLVDLDVPAIYKNDQFSEEIQLLYESDRLNGLVGFYYLKANASTEFDVLLGTSTPIFVALNLLPDTAMLFNSYTFGDVETDTWSVFGNFSYDLTDTLSIELGGRYTSDERTSQIQRRAFEGASPSFGGSTPPVEYAAFTTTPDFTGSAKFTEFDPRASITWQATPDHSFYVSYSEGFKGGSFDPRGATNAAPDLDEDGVGLTTNGVADYDDERAFILFEPEEITTYEAGWKASLQNGRYTSNLAVFFSDYTNVQIPGSIGIDSNDDGIADNFAGVTTNAAAATLYGVEWEGLLGLARDFGREGDVVDFQYALGYISAKFDEFTGQTGADVSDLAVFQNTPEITAFGQLSYTTPAQIFGSDGAANIYSSFSYRSLTHQFGYRSMLDQPGFVLFNAGLNWTPDSGRYTFSVHGTNLLDKEYIVAGYDFVTSQPAFGNSPLGLTGVLTSFYGNPRQVFATVSVNF
ncbi:TonB-dependent receptor [Hyphococcus sp.]|uniref:TonB-dependent receptor n=1 Tax=Hyphococcus sp. TaxID=2038636 RepID=UPI003CCB809C